MAGIVDTAFDGHRELGQSQGPGGEHPTGKASTPGPDEEAFRFGSTSGSETGFLALATGELYRVFC